MVSMNYLQAIAYIESLSPTLLNPSLERVAAFLEFFDSPQEKFATIHVGGTNGKGSTVAMVDAVLRGAGLKVGRFTGPHLLRWNERFHIDGQPIDDEAFAELATEVRAMSEEFGAKRPDHGQLTWFEYLTAISFFYFARQGVDVAVIEVGLGGRWDATNVLVSPTVTAITNVDLDHTHILGNTVAEIAAEKAGIIKPGVPIITGCVGDALATVRAKATAVGAPIFVCSEKTPAKSPKWIDAFNNAIASKALMGDHQKRNAMIAFAVLETVEEALGRPLLAACEKGFSTVYWPGRFQYLPKQKLLLDGAHNVSGAKALRQAIDSFLPNKQQIFVLSFFQNKNVNGLLRELVRPGDVVFAAEAASKRPVCPVSDIVKFVEELGGTVHACSSIGNSVQQARQSYPDTVLVCTGSFATVKETMLAVDWQSVEDGISHTCFDWQHVAV
jgi:dihydrofolate synthase / folylpolyglutamate synthase